MKYINKTAQKKNVYITEWKGCKHTVTYNHIDRFVSLRAQHLACVRDVVCFFERALKNDGNDDDDGRMAVRKSLSKIDALFYNLFGDNDFEKKWGRFSRVLINF